ncbi:unnamed protein product [marine sediment metagenome]|uniref:Uncharacterized protein n=1 Tax=marine sediment metagenome TaxID=412755 RepID=X1AW95_9ZZZZ
MRAKENLDADYKDIEEKLFNSVLEGKAVFNELKDTLDYIYKKRFEKRLIDLIKSL